MPPLISVFSDSESPEPSPIETSDSPSPEPLPVESSDSPSPEALFVESSGSSSTRSLSVDFHAPSRSRENYDRSQVADQPRLPWEWNPRGKTTELYTHTAVGKWWFHGKKDIERLNPNKRRDISHIGRIMETELGEQLFGDNRCTACQFNKQECWVYSTEGAQQISRPGDSCARCRLSARAGGCSLSKRRKRVIEPPETGNRGFVPIRKRMR